ncbi:MAG: NAD-binding protein, partial [Kiritimatiellia bacterium]
MKIIIIGAGDVGFHLARRLSGEHDITLVDQDPQVVKKAASALDAIVIEGDAGSLQLLKQARIQDADICAAMTHNDQLNLVACMMAKHTGNATTIARLANPEYMEEGFAIPRQALGVDFMIHPEVEAARVIHQLIRQSVPTNAVPIAEGR